LLIISIYFCQIAADYYFSMLYIVAAILTLPLYRLRAIFLFRRRRAAMLLPTAITPRAPLCLMMIDACWRMICCFAAAAFTPADARCWRYFAVTMLSLFMLPPLPPPPLFRHAR